MADGVTFRSFSRADVVAVHGLMRLIEEHDSIPYATPVEEVEEIFDDPGFDPEQMGLVAVVPGDDGAERIVGWGRVWHQPSGQRLERAHVIGGVDPRYRRRGIGTEILNRQLAVCRELLGRHDRGLPCYIRSTTLEFLADTHSLFGRAGMVPVRWYDELVRDLDVALDVEIDPGIAIVPWTEVEPEAIRQVHNEAFSDHWGSSMLSPEAWAHELKLSATRLDLSRVALASGTGQDDGTDAGPVVAGYLLAEHYPGDTEVTGRIDGWIGTLGTARAWRRRGVASGLIARALDGFREAGFSHAMIGVDADSPTGAHGLYRSLGFEPIQRMVTHQIEL